MTLYIYVNILSEGKIVMEVREIEQTKSKEDIIEILNANNISYNITSCDNCERICISLSDKKICCDNSLITLQNCN